MARPFNLTGEEVSELRKILRSSGWGIILKIYEHYEQDAIDEMINYATPEKNIRFQQGLINGLRLAQILPMKILEKITYKIQQENNQEKED